MAPPGNAIAAGVGAIGIAFPAHRPEAGFWCGPQIGVADVALFGQLGGLRTALTPGQAAAVAARPRLSAWLDRVDAATAAPGAAAAAA